MHWNLSQWEQLPEREKEHWIAYLMYRNDQIKELRDDLVKQEKLTPDGLLTLVSMQL